MVTDLTDFKNKKKLTKVFEDLKLIEIELKLSINNLDKFKKYIPVQESLAILHNSLTLIEIHINKYKRALKID